MKSAEEVRAMMDRDLDLLVYLAGQVSAGKMTNAEARRIFAKRDEEGGAE